MSNRIRNYIMNEFIDGISSAVGLGAGVLGLGTSAMGIAKGIKDSKKKPAVEPPAAVKAPEPVKAK